MVALYETDHILSGEDFDEAPVARWPIHLSLAFIGATSIGLWAVLLTAMWVF